jgi:hypothetical protein
MSGSRIPAAINNELNNATASQAVVNLKGDETMKIKVLILAITLALAASSLAKVGSVAADDKNKQAKKNDQAEKQKKGDVQPASSPLTLLPDLYIESVSAVQGNIYQAKVVIANKGGDASATLLRVTYLATYGCGGAVNTGNKPFEVPVPRIGANQKVTVTITGKLPLTPSTSSVERLAYKLTLNVGTNISNKVKESNTDNNEKCVPGKSA